MGVRGLGRSQREELSQQPAWLITFCDLIFLLLAFFVLKFSMSSPKNLQEPIPEVGINLNRLVGGEETSILGAFSPGDSAQLSFRGKTALDAFAKQAAELKQDVVIKVEILSFPEEFWLRPESVKELLSTQRQTVLRQLVDSGLSFEGLLIEPLNLPKPESFSGSIGDKSLSSRVTLILQEKRR